MSSFDLLIQHLLEEIAFDGTAGTDPSRLDSFISSYHSHLPSNSQLLDSSYLSFIWDTLVQLPDVTVGVLPTASTSSASTPVPLPHPLPSREDLVKEYGGAVRIRVSDELCWSTLTGSHARPSKLTPTVWNLLQAVARRREKGMTVTEVTRDLGLDPKSCFHFVRACTELGVMKKFEAVFERQRTNRLLHVRYLDQSKDWKEHTAKHEVEPEPEPKEDDGSDAGGDGGGGGAVMGAISKSFMVNNPAFIKRRIVRAVRESMEAGREFLHIDTANSIGLYSMNRSDLRKLRSIIKTLCRHDVLVKVVKDGRTGKKLVLELGERTLEDTVEHLSGDDDEQEEEEEAILAEEEVMSIEVWKSMERQVMDLLLEAGPAGLRNYDLSSALGNYSHRFLDQLLTRLSRVSPPSHLKDQSVIPLTENLGREKRTRWFSANGLDERRFVDGWAEVDEKEDVVQDPKIGEWASLSGEKTYKDLEERKKVWNAINTGRGWKAGGGAKSKSKPFEPLVEGFKSKKEKKSVKGGKRGRPKKIKVPKEKKAPRGKKRKRESVSVGEVGGEVEGSPAVDQKEEVEEKEEEEEEEEEFTPGPRGRPRKHPKVDGKLTYYERKKLKESQSGAMSYYERKKLEDEERRKLGLQPRKRGEKPVEGMEKLFTLPQHGPAFGKLGDIEKLPPSSKKKDKVRFEGDGVEGSQEGDGVTPPPAKRQAKTRKAKDVAKSNLADPATPDLDNTPPPLRPPAITTALTSTSSPKKTNVNFFIGPFPIRKRKSMESSSKPTPSTSQPQPPPPPPVATAIVAPPPILSSSPPVVVPPATPSATVVGSPAMDVDEPSPTPPPVPTPPPTSASTSAPAPAPAPAKVVETPAPASPIPTPLALIEEIHAALPPSRSATPEATPASPIIVNAPPPDLFTFDPSFVPPPSAKAAILTLPPLPDSTPTASTSKPKAIRKPRQSKAKFTAPPESSTTGTDAPPQPEATTSPEPKPLPSRGKKVAPKVNLSGLQRQADIIAYVEANGGIVERENDTRFGVSVKNFLEKKNPGKPIWQMDRPLTKATLRDLVEKGIMKTVTVQLQVGVNSKMNILFMSSIGVDSEEMKKFIEDAKSKFILPTYGMNEITRLSMMERVGGEGEEPEKEKNQRKGKKKGTTVSWAGEKKVKSGTAGPRIQPPSDAQNRQLIRTFFRKQNPVVGASNGCFYGRFARAKALHTAVARIIFSATPETTVFPFSLIYNLLPLGIVLQVIPIGDASEEFKTYIKVPENLVLALKELPEWVREIVGIQGTVGKKNLRFVLACLLSLNLISPLASQKTGGEGEGQATLTFTKLPLEKAGLATHLEFETKAPLYDFDSKERSLLAVLPLDTLENVQQYWDDLRAVSIRGSPPPDLRRALPDSYDFASVFDAENSEIYNNITSTTKWRESYMMLPYQRKHLANLHTQGFDTNASREKYEELADDMLAPVEEVISFYRQSQGRISRFNMNYTSKRNKKRKLNDGSAELSPSIEDGDEEREQQPSPSRSPSRSRSRSRSHSSEAAAPGVVPRTKAEMTATLRKKASDIADQRELDWLSLLDRFSKANGDIKLDGPVVEYLHKRFVSPRPPTQPLNALDLEHELRLLVPKRTTGSLFGTETIEVDAYRSIVPPGVLSRARAINDPFALPRPTRVNRPRRPRQPKTDTPVVAVAGTSGTQLEFLTEKPRDIPVLEKGQRLPRDFFSAEQNEVVMDAVAVLIVRAEEIGIRLVYTAMLKLFPGHAPAKMRNQFKQATKKPEEQFYHQRLTQAWREAYPAKKGTSELPDHDPKDLVNFEIDKFVHCLRGCVDKKALRLAGAPIVKEGTAAIVVGQPSLPPLPASIAELESKYRLKTVGAPDLRSLQWDSLFGQKAANLSMTTREKDACAYPISAPCWTRDLENDEASFALSSILKMSLVTPEATYHDPTAFQFLEPFAGQFESAIATLTANGIIRKYHQDRRAPGRNFSLTTKYLDTFEDVVTPGHTRAATRAERDLREAAEDDIWPLMAESGDMMALIDLVSSEKIDLTIDTSVTLEYRDPTSYATRQLDDVHLENAVIISFTSPDDEVPPPSQLPLVQPHPSSTDDADRLGMTLALVGQQLRDTSVNETHEALRSAGSSGLPLSTLRALLPSLPATTFDAHILSFLSSTPPLAFWAGLRMPVLVASQELSSWAIEIKPSSEPTTSRFVFPTLWVDYDARVVSTVWSKASGWVKSVLVRFPGSTCLQIHERSQEIPGGLLTLIEVMQVLLSLKEFGQAELRTVHQVTEELELEDANEVVLVNWEEHRWFLSDGWYRS